MNEITQGQQTIAVHFEEHPEVGYLHDVNLVKLDGQTDLSEIVQWMNWMNLDGMTTPAPAVFLGGAQEMPTG
ncbi:MAG: hypothetical protein WD597_14790, partial [Balneolaceae bacterium]